MTPSGTTSCGFSDLLMARTLRPFLSPPPCTGREGWFRTLPWTHALCSSLGAVEAPGFHPEGAVLGPHAGDLWEDGLRRCRWVSLVEGAPPVCSRGDRPLCSALSLETQLGAGKLEGAGYSVGSRALNTLRAPGPVVAPLLCEVGSGRPQLDGDSEQQI